ncbi:MAG: hypothetical protein ACI9KE_000531 [Polyangiales bacterium]
MPVLNVVAVELLTEVESELVEALSHRRHRADGEVCSVGCASTRWVRIINAPNAADAIEAQLELPDAAGTASVADKPVKGDGKVLPSANDARVPPTTNADITYANGLALDNRSHRWSRSTGPIVTSVGDVIAIDIVAVIKARAGVTGINDAIAVRVVADGAWVYWPGVVARVVTRVVARVVTRVVTSVGARRVRTPIARRSISSGIKGRPTITTSAVERGRHVAHHQDIHGGGIATDESRVVEGATREKENRK